MIPAEVITGVIGFFLVITVYFLPSAVASHREHHQRAAIAVLNTFLGWTLLGWVVALVWASTAIKHQQVTR
jgi:Superinfection immunity protein